MSQHIILTQVDPFAGDTFETLRYRSCDFCYETAVEDIWAGKRQEEEWRTFYVVEGECGLIVCGNCLPDLLAGKLE